MSVRKNLIMKKVEMNIRKKKQKNKKIKTLGSIKKYIKKI